MRRRGSCWGWPDTCRIDGGRSAEGSGAVATWQELSLDNLRAAKMLAGEGRLRSSISRSYYAAYCAVSGVLVDRGITFPHGWNNPAHEQLPDLVSHNLPLPPDARRRLRK